MEERQLNFNQPLLSVRRGSSMAAQPEINLKKAHDSETTVPPLPYYKSDLKSGPVRNPGVVPFQWEQMPGRPKDENKVPKDNIWQLAVAPKLPPGTISMAKDLVAFEGSAKDAKDKNISNCDDDNVTFVDAHDRYPSMADSGIFLPAAKAVTSETRHFVPRKHSGTRGELKPVTRLIKWKQKVSQGRFPCKVDGKEVDDKEYVRIDDMSDKLCGLLPKFCVLNPVPGMRDHARAVSVVTSVHTRPEYAESCRKTVKQDKTNSDRGNMKRVAHQHASKPEPLIDKDFCGRIITPLEDGLHHLFLDEEKRIQDAQQTTIQANLYTEKTLYVDSEPTEHYRNSISGSCSLQDMKSITFRDERQIFPSKSSDTIDSRVVSTREKTFQDDAEDLQKHQDFNRDVVKEGVNESGLFTLGLLLPKSPSESWLSRTLPSMPAKKPTSKLYFGNLAYR